MCDGMVYWSMSGVVAAPRDLEVVHRLAEDEGNPCAPLPQAPFAFFHVGRFASRPGRT